MRALTSRAILPLILLGLLGAPELLEAQRRCQRGKPCGNTCIARHLTCRVGPGTARAAPRPTPQRAAVQVPDSAQFIASSRGRVYYWRGCSAWRRLASANLIFFGSRAQAEEAGYRPSTQAGCSGPAAAGPEDSAETPAAAIPENPGTPLPSGSTCTIARVTDGDTVVCSTGHRIRLLLIDAPEMDQGHFGTLARDVALHLAPPGTETRVELDLDPIDRYERTLAYLILPDGRILNEELLRAGVAVVSSIPPNVRHVDRFRMAAEEARAAGAGLWSLNGFECLPAEHRAGRCE